MTNLANKLKVAMEHIEGTADFAIQQSLEEVSRVVETAAAHIEQTHGITNKQLLATPEIASGLNLKPTVPFVGYDLKNDPRA